MGFIGNKPISDPALKDKLLATKADSNKVRNIVIEDLISVLGQVGSDLYGVLNLIPGSGVRFDIDEETGQTVVNATLEPYIDPAYTRRDNIEYIPTEWIFRYLSLRDPNDANNEIQLQNESGYLVRKDGNDSILVYDFDNLKADSNINLTKVDDKYYIRLDETYRDDIEQRITANRDDINTLIQQVSTNTSNIASNAVSITNNSQVILSNGRRITDNEYEIQLLKDNQVTGVIQKNTYADLVATTPIENVSFKVTNDPNSSLNGYYHFEGTSIVKDADLANGVVEEGNVDAVSGGEVYEKVYKIFSNRNKVENSRFMFQEEEDNPFSFETGAGSSGTPVFNVIDSEYFTNEVNVICAAGDRGTIVSDFDFISGANYSSGFFYKVISGSAVPTVAPFGFSSGGLISDGTIREVQFSDGWKFISREGMVATGDYSGGENFIIDCNNTAEASESSILIAMPIIVEGKITPEVILDGWSYAMRKLNESYSETKIVSKQILDTINPSLVQKDDLINTSIESYDTVIMPLLDIKKGQTYTINSQSNDSLTSGLRFYIDTPSVVEIKDFPSSSDFTTGVSFEYTAINDTTLYWRVFEVGKTVTFDIYHNEYEPKVSRILNNISEEKILYSLENYDVDTTTLFGYFDVSGLLGSILTFSFSGNYTGSFYVYAFRDDDSFYTIKEITNFDFSNGTIFEIIVPNDAVYLNFRTFNDNVTINLSISGDVIKKGLLPDVSGGNSWENNEIVTYGDSITAINNGTFEAPYPLNNWGNIVADYLSMSKQSGRGIGGQTYSYNTKVAWVDSVSGEYLGRDDNLLFENITQQDLDDAILMYGPNTVPVKGAFCSWLRIKTMIPESTREQVGIVFIMGGTNDYDNVSEVPSNTGGVDRPLWSASNISDDDWINDVTYGNGGDYDISEMYGGVASTIMKIQTWCPNAVIVLGTPLSGRENSGDVYNVATNNHGLTTQDVAIHIINIGQYMSVPVVDVYSGTGINQINRDEYISDAVHPYDPKGYKALAKAVIGGLKSIIPYFD